MIPKNLLELVVKLKERIDKHGYQFQDSEALTRYALIDPLLRELGWDTEDPTLVIPEYQTGNGEADYALLGVEKPVMMVESKTLGAVLWDALEQGRQYCDATGAKYLLLTDGRRWELYESGKPTSVIDFDLKSQTPADVCRKALALRRPSVQSGHITPVPEPIDEPSDDSPGSLGVPVTNVPPPPPNGEWVPLTGGIVTKGVKPIKLEFPNGKRVPLPYWNRLMTEPTIWLYKRRHLTRSSTPILRAKQGNRKREPKIYMISTTPYHPDATQMTNPAKVSSIWVEKNFSPDNCVKNAITIIKKTGQDPSKFSVLTKPRRKNFPR